MKSRFTYLFLLFLALVACEKDIEIELNKQSDKLVMYAFIYPDSALNLHFSKSQSILSVDDYKQIEKGRFQIFINDSFQGTYILPSDTVWSNWKEFSFNERDKIKITAYEFEGDTATAESKIPHKINILNMDTLSINQNISELGNVDMLRTKITFLDPAHETNYYQLLVVREGWGDINSTEYYTRNTITYEKDDLVFTQGEQSGSLLPGINFQGLFTDEIINGLEYELGFNIPKDNLFFDYYEDKIKITVYLYHHTDDYYSYFRSIILAAGYEGFYEELPVFEPVKIHTNIKNGLGVLSGMNFDSDSLVFVK
ncbi:DUF4249 domain-containing protein [Carboxylicivirga marina]|uniref:DUF4249 domain-containing protein n=1 Tax=Carboxylicivirga marina TaxID=2800988 RepID=A0ABS1HGD4_9BACT|nr:DUF4249 domain-containing protein [Carboxylicivirga marina]MBK3516726.1 DUF4249 domain-containing protein [Carboxylicivirga marina]